MDHIVLVYALVYLNKSETTLSWNNVKLGNNEV